ncbi:PREDICTED: collagen alpha-1(XII) chain-like [Priapulus caudatus]|uniref:Collagen alpha-1(XII) chain-like n=1 Tax=Priapulus caudatus TaxID=37621 RepID=A0ABM1FBM0_PRICU|nr:PREDICTED: collagen alpha-1(XII) chain-like [Priapulus caudatus]
MMKTLSVVVLLGVALQGSDAQSLFDRVQNPGSNPPTVTTTLPPVTTTLPPVTTTLPPQQVDDTDFFSIDESAKRIVAFRDKVAPRTDPFSIDANPQTIEEVDVILMVDRSYSVGREGFRNAKCVLREWAQLFQDNIDIRFRVTLLSFARYPTLDSVDYFRTYNSFPGLLNAIDNLKYYRHGDNSCPVRPDPNNPHGQWISLDGCATCTHSALDEAYSIFFDYKYQNGEMLSRFHSTKAIIVVTDGKSNCPSSAPTCRAARKLRERKVNIFVQAVGRQVDAGEVRCIATEDDYNLNADYSQTCRSTTLAREIGAQRYT